MDSSSVSEIKERVKAMREERKSGSEEEFEMINTASLNEGNYEKAVVLKKVLNLDLRNQSTYMQLAIGGATGWLTGYMVGKVGKAMASAVGGTILLVNMGTRAGYITVDWDKVDEDMKAAGDEMHKKLAEQRDNEETKETISKVSSFVRKNVVTAGGFAAGFFLGLAC